jgi:hypothetical protein
VWVIHLARARWVSYERFALSGSLAGSIRSTIRDTSRPIGSILIGIEHTDISDRVFFVVLGKGAVGRR